MKNKDCVCTEICLNPSNCPIKPRNKSYDKKRNT